MSSEFKESKIESGSGKTRELFAFASGVAKSAEPDFNNPISQGEDLRYSSLLIGLRSPNVVLKFKSEPGIEALIIEIELVVIPEIPANRKRKTQAEIHIWIIDFSPNLFFIVTLAISQGLSMGEQIHLLATILASKQSNSVGNTIET